MLIPHKRKAARENEVVVLGRGQAVDVDHG